jgi:hypothetical protein
VSTKVEPQKAYRFFTLSILLGMLVVNVHTYAAIPMLIAVFLWQALQIITVRRVNLRELASVLLFAFPVALLLVGQAFLFSRDPAFAQKAATPTLTPSPVILIGSYGFIALGAVLGLPAAWRKVKSGEKGWALLLAWTIAIIVSIHLPVSFQRKMIEGLHVALCFLTALALEEWAKRFGEKQGRDEGRGTKDEAGGAKGSENLIAKVKRNACEPTKPTKQQAEKVGEQAWMRFGGEQIVEEKFTFHRLASPHQVDILVIGIVDEPKVAGFWWRQPPTEDVRQPSCEDDCHDEQKQMPSRHR